MMALAALLITVTAHAELKIEITQGADKPTPVAIVPFSWDGNYGLQEDVASVISADLARSGLFSVMAPANMLSTPTSADAVNYRDWRVSGMDYLVIGRISQQDGNQVRVDYELFDVIKQQRIKGSNVVGDRTGLRGVAHAIADDIYEQLTGIRGAFYTRIAYVTAEDIGRNQKLYKLKVADSDGARATAILKSKEPILSPVWSRDASKLAYVSFETTRPVIYIQDLKNGQRQRVQSFPGLNGAPAWSPDGKKLALVLSKDGNPEVYILDLASRRLDRVTHHYGIDTEPAWAPDGRSLIFTSDRGGQPQIYRFTVASRNLERLTFSGNYNSRGSFTFDGRFMAMVHRGDDNIFHIAVQDLETGRIDILTETSLDESPTIAPNGSIIMYATQVGTQGVLGGVTLDGGVRFLLPESQGDVREPAWSPYLN